MKQIKLPPSTYRMLKVLDCMVEKKIASTQEEAALQIGVQPVNISKLRSGDIQFSLRHIETACRLSGASADYVFGFTNTMMRKTPKDPLEAMKDALIALQARFNENLEK